MQKADNIFRIKVVAGCGLICVGNKSEYIMINICRQIISHVISCLFLAGSKSGEKKIDCCKFLIVL